MQIAVQMTAIISGSLSVAVLTGIVCLIVWLDASEFDPNEPWN